jgi:hypothetical protein
MDFVPKETVLAKRSAFSAVETRLMSTDLDILRIYGLEMHVFEAMNGEMTDAALEQRDPTQIFQLIRIT